MTQSDAVSATSLDTPVTLQLPLETAPPDGLTPAVLQSKFGRKLRVVIVDDDPKFAHLMEYIGIQQGFLVTSYLTVEEIDLPHLAAADIIVMDYNLDTSNGLDISHELRAKGVNVPLLLVSASQDAFKQEHWGDNICGFTSKELGPFAVLESILQVVNSRVDAAAGAGPAKICH